MTVTPVPVAGVLAVIAKAADDDIEAATELWRISLYEALADLSARYGTLLDRDLSKAAAVRTASARRALVRTYIGKRLTGAEIDELLTVAGHLTLEEIGKDETTETRRAAQLKELRDHGRYARAHAGIDRMGELVGGGGGQSALARVARPTNGTDRRIYRQLSAVGGALTAAGASSGNAHAALLGSAAGLVGTFGPEAEDVLGHPIRRTAYRYRGTERRPDRAIQLQARQVNATLDTLATTERSDPGQALALREQLAAAGGRGQRRPADVDGILAHQLAGSAGRNSSVDQLRLRTVSDLATARLATELPDLEAARLSLASGKLPPSRGFIIDADGDLVSEAQGFNGDHYLPFDLKNLRRLHGGAYVRTRTTGGPTDEDIYTGLLTGARQLQVISASGVFTIEFDQDLRGGRRYSDKARAMVDRYSRLLSAVGSGDVLSTDLTPREQASIRARYASDHPHLPPDQLKTGGDAEVERERQLRKYSTKTDEELHDEAAAQATEELKGRAGGQSIFEQTQASIYAGLRSAEDKKAVRAYRLDAEGYKAAMTSLEQEFPFYVRSTKVTPLRQWLAARRLEVPESLAPYVGTDIGRVLPGKLAPVSAKHAGRAAETAAGRAATGGSNALESDTPAAETTTAERGATAPGGSGMAWWIAPGTRPLSAAVADEKSRFIRQMAVNLGLLTQAAAFEPNLFPPADAAMAGAIAHYDPGAFISWLNSMPSPEAAAKLLADPGKIAGAQSAIALLEQSKLGEKDLAGPRALADQLEVAKTIAMPFTKPDGDPVLTAPVDDRPVAFADIEALGDRMDNYTNYLSAHDDVAQAVPMVDGDPAVVSAAIAEGIEDYQAMVRWAGEGFAPGAAGRLDEDDLPKAQEIAQLGTSSPPYLALAAQQRAFALAVQRQALAALTGEEIPAGEPTVPKVESPPEPKPEGSIGKRGRRVIVHPLGSPTSVALAKRQVSRSALPSRSRR